MFKIIPPLLMIQNFDDETVCVNQTLAFYDVLKRSQANMELVSVLIIPQGADSPLQESSGPLDMATCGHSVPVGSKYKKEFTDAINRFVNGQQKNNFSDAIIAHTRRLYKNRENNDATTLYRLYFASMHEDKSPIKKMDRLRNVFMSYAKHLVGKDMNAMQAKVMDLMQLHGAALIYSIDEKQHSFLKAIHKKDFLKALKAGSQRIQRPMSLRERLKRIDSSCSTLEAIRDVEEKQFYLTEEAREHLKERPDSLEYLDQQRKSYFCINQDLLKSVLSPSDNEKKEHNLKLLLGTRIKNTEEQEKFLAELSRKGVSSEDIIKHLMALIEAHLKEEDVKIYLTYVFGLFSDENNQESLKKRQDMTILELIKYADMNDIICWNEKSFEDEDEKLNSFYAYNFIAAQTLRAPGLFVKGSEVRKHYLLNVAAKDLLALELDLKKGNISLINLSALCPILTELN